MWVIECIISRREQIIPVYTIAANVANNEEKIE